MKKRQRKVRLIRAAIQLVFFIVAPALFSTAFAGVKSIFQAIAAGQPVTWNSFLDVTGALLLITVLFGRHFCGYACAFGSLGDAMYELTLFIRQKVFHKKGRHGYPEKVVRCLQKVKYILLAFILLSIFTGWYANLQGMSPWDVFSMLTARKLPNASYKIGIILLVLILIGMCTQERFFCQFLCPMGAVFALMPILPSALHRQNFWWDVNIIREREARIMQRGKISECPLPGSITRAGTSIILSTGSTILLMGSM